MTRGDRGWLVRFRGHSFEEHVHPYMVPADEQRGERPNMARKKRWPRTLTLAYMPKTILAMVASASAEGEIRLSPAPKNFALRYRAIPAWMIRGG